MTRKVLWIESLIGASSLFALVYVALSLGWPVVQDLRILLYEGFLLVDHGLIPYRDFFDFNPPGSILLFGAIHRLTAGAQPAIRFFDLAVLAAIAAATFLALRRQGTRAGIFAAASFAALYLSAGPRNSLQREYLGVLLLALAVALVFGDPRPRYRFVLCGLLAGLALTVKPPLVLCWLPLLAYAPGEPAGRPFRRLLLERILLFSAGFLVPLALVAGWLNHHGALGAFVDMARNYYPLYTRIDGQGVVHESGLRELADRYLVKTLPLLLKPLAVVAALGLWAGAKARDPHLKAQSAVCAAMVAAALFYLPISGKFWNYHQIPLFYALSLGAATAVGKGFESPENDSRWRTGILMLAILASFPFGAFAFHWNQWSLGLLNRADQANVEPLVAYLREKTTAADTIAPLDTSTGALHALYLARRPLYGRFLYDFHFYHDAANPYVADLRRQFLAQFSGGRPSVLLACESWRPRDPASASFPELDAMLRRDYVLALKVNSCAVLRRR